MLNFIYPLLLSTAAQDKQRPPNCFFECAWAEAETEFAPRLEESQDDWDRKTAKAPPGPFPKQYQDAIFEFWSLATKATTMCQAAALESYALKTKEPAETVVSAALGSCPRLQNVTDRAWRLYVRSRLGSGADPGSPEVSQDLRNDWLALVLKIRTKAK